MKPSAEHEHIRAVVVDRQSPDQLVIKSLPPPQPAPSQALVRVAAFSLNRGEVRRALKVEPDGWRPGWEFAGTIEAAAADGSGLPIGPRVVGMLRNAAWAELVAAPALELTQVPEGVSPQQASTLPIAGLTAMFALTKSGNLLGRRVLISGASGGLGSFACQLAHLAGAHVVAAIRNPQYEALVRRLGADHVAIGADLSAAASAGPFDLVLESVGGPSLAAALTMLAPDGLCIQLGASNTSEVSFDTSKFRVGGTSLYGLSVFHELKHEPITVGLARLMRLIADGKLKPEIAVEQPWTNVASIAKALIDRKFVGKAVLTI